MTTETMKTPAEAGEAKAAGKQLRPESMLDVQQTTCCVVGGGPAGAILALLLARRGVPVTLLEMHKDFDRQFRGDTLHPSVLEILNQIGLSEKVHQLPHTKATGPTVQFADGLFQPFDLTELKTLFPYILLVPQARFLEFITAEAAKYPSFRLVLGASVKALVRENGVVRGVQYLTEEGWHELRASLVVAADGRFSQVRQLLGIEPVKNAPPMDVLWFKLPKLAQDMEIAGGVGGAIGNGKVFIVLDRGTYWQAGLVFPKGHYQKLHAEGIAGVRRIIAQTQPLFAPNAESLQDWKQVALLSVESSRCTRWHQPGVLLIGDAAHVMSPIAGVGINYAIQDAAVAANVLSTPLKNGQITEAHLAEVQRQREWPTRIVQLMQGFFQKNLIGTALGASKPIRVPWQLRLLTKIPFLRMLPAYLFAFGARRVRVLET